MLDDEQELVNLGSSDASNRAPSSDTTERRRLRVLFAELEPSVVEQVLAHGGPANAGLDPTEIVPGYRIHEVAGRGGMGVVFSATQLSLDRRVALKLLAPSIANDDTFRQRFLRESRLAASIDHPNVLPVYEAGDADGLLYVAMRFVDGYTLEELVRALGPLDPERALRIAGQVAAALDAAHSRGLVHRDVKPANIMLTTEDVEHAYLMDFGIATSVELPEGVTQRDELLGTVEFMSPEQARGDLVTESSDVYALSATLYYALCAHVPFDGETSTARLLAKVAGPPQDLAAHAPGIPAGALSTIEAGLDPDPSIRPPSAGAFVAQAASAIGTA